MKSLQQLQVSAENDTTSMSFANMHITFKLDFHNYKNSLNDSREIKDKNSRMKNRETKVAMHNLTPAAVMSN